MLKKILTFKTLIYVVAALSSGALYALAFPPAGLYFAAWFALIPLLLMINGRGLLFSFTAAFVTGMIANIGIFYWIYTMMYFNTGSIAQSLLCLLVLCAYLSLYFGVWGLLISFSGINLSVFRFSLLAGCLWVGLEYLRSCLFTGFPWALLGLSQWQCLPLCQVSEFTGVYGVSFLLVFMGAGTASLIKKPGKYITYLLLLVSLMLIVLFGKVLQINNAVESTPNITVGVVQASIDQYKKWDKAYEDEIKGVYAGLINTLSKCGPDIIIWPETAVPGYLPADRELYGWVRGLAKASGSYNLVGAPYNNGGDNDYYNAVILFGPEGEMLGVHKKTHLVPFGEFVPFRSLLAPYFGILNTLGDFKRGKQYNVFPVKSIMWASTICSENFFGGAVRRFVLNGAEIIVNQTNDAWFFKTAAARQHFIMNVFRAIENRRPIVVSGNTGISGVVGADGGVSQQTGLFERTVFTARVAPSRKITFYTKYGDIFSQLCLLMALLLLLGAKHDFFKKIISNK